MYNKDRYGMRNNRLIERLGISVHCEVKFIGMKQVDFNYEIVSGSVC